MRNRLPSLTNSAPAMKLNLPNCDCPNKNRIGNPRHVQSLFFSPFILRNSRSSSGRFFSFLLNFPLSRRLLSLFETEFLFLFAPPSLPLIVVRPHAPTQPPSISSLCNYVNVMFVFIGSCHSVLAAALSQLGSIALLLQAGLSTGRLLRMAHLAPNHYFHDSN